MGTSNQIRSVLNASGILKSRQIFGMELIQAHPQELVHLNSYGVDWAKVQFVCLVVPFCLQEESKLMLVGCLAPTASLHSNPIPESSINNV